VEDWQTLLQPRDLRLLAEVRASGADLNWRKKELISDSGRTVVHSSVVVTVHGGKRLIASSGPADFRHRDRNQLVLRLVRSALHQAHARLRPDCLVH